MHLSAASIPPLITSLVFAALGFFVFLKKENRGGTKGYALWCLITVCWQGSWTILFNVHDVRLAEFLVHAGYFWIAFIPVTFYDFAVGYLNDEKHQRRLPTLYAISGLFAASSFTSKGLVSGMYQYSWGYYPKAGPLHPLYLCFIAIVVGNALWLLIEALRHNNRGDAFRNNTRVVLLAPIIYTFSAIDFLANYGVGFYPYGFIFTLLSLFLIAYAILHYHLLDIRLILRDTTVNIVTGALLAGGVLSVALPLSAANHVVGTLLGVVSMVLVMMFVYDPIRRTIQPMIDRIVFADRFAYLEELGQIPNDMLEFTNLREMLKFLVTRLTDAARLERVRVLMYDPGQQSYVETIVHSSNAIRDDGAATATPHDLPESSALARLLRENRRLLVDVELSRISEQNAGSLAELKALGGVACFPVMKGRDMMGCVILGPKRSGESFNQQDIKILKALRTRLENFLGQAMAITQEALNMVKDSHDMKNDVNALKGRVTWRAMRIAGWKLEFEKQLLAIEKGFGQASPETVAAFEMLKKQAQEWFQEADRSRTIEGDAIQRLAHRLKNWAEYGRVVSEGFKGSRYMEAIEIREAARLSVERWRPHAEKKGLTMSLEPGGPLWVWGERSLVEQVIENLLDNAIKATNQGAVEVVCSARGDDVRLEVRDTGCGIPADDLPTIFEKPFYQGRGRESLEQSTGVGLYLVSQYVRSLGGKVWAESKVGKGSSFFVQWPKFDPTQAQQKTGAAA